jgi:hypothetical protein
MNRHDLKRLTLERLKDADILLKAHRAQAAYYLTGYDLDWFQRERARLQRHSRLSKHLIEVAR